jgi:hypothetical protein
MRARYRLVPIESIQMIPCRAKLREQILHPAQSKGEAAC